MFENRVLRKIFGVERRNYRKVEKVRNAELDALHSLLNIIRNLTSRQLRWSGYVGRREQSRNVYRDLVGRPEGKRSLSSPRCRSEDNIKMDLREVGCDVGDWIDFAQDESN